MIAAFLTYASLGLAIFYLQNLVFFPRVHLRLLALLLFYVGLRPSLALALLLALTLGVLQDSFATTPLGLHLGAALVLVGAARVLRPRLLWQRFFSQVVGGLLALALQEVFLLACTTSLGYGELFNGEMLSHHAAEILGTAVLGPLMSLLVQGLEKSLRRFGWRPLDGPAAYRPLP